MIFYLSLALYASWLISASKIHVDVDISSFPQEHFAQATKSGIGKEYFIADDERATYPEISLDYAKHQVTLVNQDVGYLLYKNIRYAKHPTGDLRFALPEAPDAVDENAREVLDGSYGNSCLYTLEPFLSTFPIRWNSLITQRSIYSE
jgi:hypothetical protein